MRKNLWILWMLVIFSLNACGKNIKEAKIRDCEYTVLDKEEIPVELQTMIEERKTNCFRLAYEETGYLYLAQGYGRQKGGGYSIAVDHIYETEHYIYFANTLIGPEEENEQGETMPFVCVKLEALGKEVSFEA